MDISRRKLIAVSGAAGLTWPALSFPALAAPNYVAWHDRTLANHNQAVAKWASQGFRTTSLCMYGSARAPLHAAVMVKRQKVHAERQFPGISAAMVNSRFSEMAAQGWGPYIITATGAPDNPVMAISFRPMSYIPLTRYGIAKKDFNELNKQQYETGFVLGWVDSYGTPEDTRYAAIWVKNDLDAEWNCEAVDEAPDKLQARFDAHESAGVRPDLIAVTPAGNYMESFTNARIGDWVSAAGLSSAGYQEKFSEQVAQGYYPHRVAAKGEGAETKFAAIFTKRETPYERVFRSTGPVTRDSIDTIIEGVMKAHQYRSASLSITYGSKLVYTKGYTWSEPNGVYPDATPTTCFRIGSVSKLFTAVAMHRLFGNAIANSVAFSSDTTLQSILNLTQPDGSPPKDDQFADITLRHLLESTAGVEKNVVEGKKTEQTAFAWVKAAKEFNTSLPVTLDQLVSYATTINLTNAPGATDNVIYGNMAYIILSKVLMKLTQSRSYLSALEKTVLSPLGIKRVRNARTAAATQLPDEALYTAQRLALKKSVISDNRELVPHQYGGFDMAAISGSGGLSGAGPDVARLMAMFSLRHNNPVLNTQTMDAMLESAYIASAYTGPNPKEAHGYHGFDQASVVSKDSGIYTVRKGGLVPGAQCSAVFSTGGGFGYFIAVSGNDREDLGVPNDNWKKQLNSALVPSGLSQAADLFPAYGMESF